MYFLNKYIYFLLYLEKELITFAKLKYIFTLSLISIEILLVMLNEEVTKAKSE